MRPLAELIRPNIRTLAPYSTARDEYGGQRIDVWLDANESPYDNGVNRYPDPLAEKVVTAFADYYGINPKYVTAGNGSDELIFLIEAAFMEKGDRMLCVAPDFSMYKFYSSICEVECDTFIKSDDLSIDTDALIEKVNRDNIKLLLFSVIP